MKIAMTYICLWICTLGCILFLGCASTPDNSNTIATDNVATNQVNSAIGSTNIVSNNIAINTNNVEISSTTNSLTFTKTLPKDKPSPWEYSISEITKTIQIDGAQIYLYNSPQKQTKTNKRIPHFIDQTKTIDVIFNAHNSPIITNRPLRVFIDPGHGGLDPGAISKDKKLYEKTITLDIAKRLQTYLSAAGFITMLSRVDNSTTLSLEERETKANSWGADIFISIHINSSKSSEPNGFETYILANHGQLSTSMDKASMTQKDWNFVNCKYAGNKNDNKNLLLGFAIHRRTVKTSRIPDRGLRRARFSVLRNVMIPAVLVECGFLSSPKDSKLLYTADFRERCARGIYQGICDYAYGRMQPGLIATPVPSANNCHKKFINNSETKLIPSQESNFTPTRLIDAMEYRPQTQQPIWKPNYEEDNPNDSKELAAAREKALQNAGIILSPKTNNSTGPQDTPTLPKK